MKNFKKLEKLKKGDKVAIVSPSFAAPGAFPEVYELGFKRLREIFELEPIEYSTTRKIGASGEERSKDLISAFEDKEIKAVIATIGGDDQVTYIKNLPKEHFLNNPKAFFGYSDNSHFCNFLFMNGIPSFYGGSIMTQFAMQKEMDEYTVSYIKHALFDEGEFEIKASEEFNEIGLDWGDASLLNTKRTYEKNEGFLWDNPKNTEGILWGGCLESIDEMLRHNIDIPSPDEFNEIVLMLETSEEMPDKDYVFRVIRAFGERDILKRVKAVCVGRPKTWEFDKPQTEEERKKHREDQRKTILETVRTYNKDIPIIQNMNFGHTDPQVPMPYGGKIRIQEDKKMFASF